MNVHWELYLNESEPAKGAAAKEHQLDWHFDYDDKQHWIPTLYCFEQGVIFDLLTIITEQEMHAFNNQYGNFRDRRPSALEQKILDSESPIQFLSLTEAKVNGQILKSGGSTASCYFPWQEEYGVEEEVRAFYANALGAEVGFVWSRYRFLFTAEWSRDDIFAKINQIEIEMDRTTRFLPCHHSFSLPYNFNGIHQEIIFHPETRTEHHLYFQDIKHQETTVFFGRASQKTLYQTNLKYKIVPPLLTGDVLEYDEVMIWAVQDEVQIPLALVREDNLPEQQAGANRSFDYVCAAVPTLDKQAEFKVTLLGINTKKNDYQRFFFRKKEY